MNIDAQLATAKEWHKKMALWVGKNPKKVVTIFCIWVVLTVLGWIF